MPSGIVTASDVFEETFEIFNIEKVKIFISTRLRHMVLQKNNFMKD